jgi:16S rRNA (guanine966-N2)-methyltransferase
VRPTPDRVREALFSILGPGALDGPVLDLFAGTGALGLEAVSRGSPRAVFVERSRDSLRAIRANIETVDAAGRCRVLARSALSLRPADLPEAPFRLILADPPYDLVDRAPGRERITALLETLARGILALDGDLVLEHRRGAPSLEAAALRVADRREYGDTALTFYRHVRDAG